MSSNTAGIIFVLFVLVIYAIFSLRAKRRQKISEELELSSEEISFWSVIEETSNRLVLKIESTDTIFTFDRDAGIITQSDDQSTDMPKPSQLAMSKVEKLLVSFEDAPTGIDPYAKLALVTTQGEKFQIIRGYRYLEVVSPMAEKIAGFIHKEIKEEILANGTFWEKAG